MGLLSGECTAGSKSGNGDQSGAPAVACLRDDSGQDQSADGNDLDPVMSRSLSDFLIHFQCGLCG